MVDFGSASPPVGYACVSFTMVDFGSASPPVGYACVSVTFVEALIRNYPRPSRHSHSIVPGGLDVMS
jgi:hypothetical protein